MCIISIKLLMKHNGSRPSIEKRIKKHFKFQLNILSIMISTRLRYFVFLHEIKIYIINQNRDMKVLNSFVTYG